MRRPDLRFRLRHLMTVVAVVAVGLLLLPATPPGAGEILLRPYPGNRQPSSGAHSLRVRLDLDRLRALGRSKDDVMAAMQESRMIDPSDPRPPDPPPGVVFTTRYIPPDQWENVVLWANAEGEIIRLKDIAEVEFDR